MRLFKRELVLLSDWKKSGVHAGFTTRHFPLTFHRTDDLREPENQKKFITRFPTLEKFALLDQVHGDEIAVLTGAGKFTDKGFYHIPQCDAVITDIPGMTLLVFSADCLPVFFLAGSWIGLAHAGWRGSQKKVSAKTLDLLAEKAGVKAAEVKIYFGPSIGAKHYEVGPEFKEYFPRAVLHGKNGKLYFDLAKENYRQLCESGATQKNITNHAICTVSKNKNFYSFRKEKDSAGRIISFITKV